MKKILRLIVLTAAVSLGGCKFLDSLPPIQFCVTYKGKTFCASKANGQWRFEADLSPDEQAEIVRHIEGN